MIRVPWRARSYPYFLILPSVLVILLMIGYPVIVSFGMSLNEVTLTTPSRFVGIQNYVALLGDRDFLQSIIVSCTFTVAVVLVELVAGLGVCLLLDKPLRGVQLVRALALAPLVMTPVAVGLLWRLMYNPIFGVLTYLARSVGINTLWLADPSTALLSVMIVDIWICTGWAAILFYAGLQAIPPEQYEAAVLEGASKAQVFRHITIPWITPMILIYLVIRTSDAFQIFDIVFSLTMGGPGGSTETVSLFTYLWGFRTFELGYASAASWIIVSFAIVMSIFYFRLLKTQWEV